VLLPYRAREGVKTKQALEILHRRAKGDASPCSIEQSLGDVKEGLLDLAL
jgi:hypothetical protein